MVAKLRIFAEAHVPVIDDVRKVLALHDVTGPSISARTCAGVATLEIEHPRPAPEQARAITEQLQAVVNIRHAEYEALG